MHTKSAHTNWDETGTSEIKPDSLSIDLLHSVIILTLMPKTKHVLCMLCDDSFGEHYKKLHA